MGARARARIAALWAVLTAAFVVFFKLGEGGDAPLAIIVISSMVLATVVIGFVRARRALARVQMYLAAGEPDRLLKTVDRKLRYVKRPRRRAPLLVFKAAGLSMKGEWERGLEALGEIGPEDLPEENRAVWELGYHGARMSCLIFLERIEEARRVFEEHLEPLAGSGEVGDPSAVLDAGRAQLLFCEGERAESRRIFERLIADLRTPPASRALFHYFLGRIFRDYGNRVESKRHFERAAELAPKTWIPAGIEALESRV